MEKEMWQKREMKSDIDVNSFSSIEYFLQIWGCDATATERRESLLWPIHYIANRDLYRLFP
jgi:hypothetical protein